MSHTSFNLRKRSISAIRTTFRGGFSSDNLTQHNKILQYPPTRLLTNSSLTSHQRRQVARSWNAPFDWRSWDGRVWDPKEIPTYLDHPYSEAAAYARAELRGLDERRSLQPEAADVHTFLANHYNALLDLGRKHDPIHLLCCDMEATSFLLTTTPMFRSFYHPGLTTAIHNYHRQSEAIKTDSTHLRSFQSYLRDKKHNPLLFQERTKRFLHTVLPETTGPSKSAYLDPSSKLWIVDPFRDAIRHVTKGTKRLALQYDLFNNGKLKNLRGKETANRLLRQLQDLEGFLHISHDLIALRYHRVHRFGENVSGREIQLGKALNEYSRARKRQAYEARKQEREAVMGRAVE